VHNEALRCTTSSASSLFGGTSSTSSVPTRNNSEYKMVDLDIPPFLRRNKD